MLLLIAGCWAAGNQWLSYVVDDVTGEIAATAIFGPGLVLLVTESYREPGSPLPSAPF